MRPRFITLLVGINICSALALSALGLLMLGFAYLSGSGLATAPQVWITLGGLMVWTLSIVQMTCAVALWRLRPLGRTLQIALALVGLPLVPLGTAASIAVLLYLRHPGVRALFASGEPSVPVPPAFRHGVATLLGCGGLAIATVVVFSMFAIPDGDFPVHWKRTMADMRTLGTALGSYEINYGGYPTSPDLESASRHFDQDYVSDPPLLDGWRRPLRYETVPAPEGEVLPQHYCLGSAGADGEWEHENLADYAPRETRDLDCDIVYCDGEFVQYRVGSIPGRRP